MCTYIYDTTPVHPYWYRCLEHVQLVNTSTNYAKQKFFLESELYSYDNTKRSNIQYHNSYCSWMLCSSHRKWLQHITIVWSSELKCVQCAWFCKWEKRKSSKVMYRLYGQASYTMTLWILWHIEDAEERVWTCNLYAATQEICYSDF